MIGNCLSPFMKRILDYDLQFVARFPVNDQPLAFQYALLLNLAACEDLLYGFVPLPKT